MASIYRRQKSTCYMFLMNNESLFLRIKKLVTEERRIGVEILECLYEIEMRKSYAELKYDGLFSYCVKELGFSESQAYQRIQAMRAVKEVPEIKHMIESGSLSVSSVSKVQVHFREEQKCGVIHSTEEKLQVFKMVENHTTKETEKVLAIIRGEKIRAKLVLELDEETEELWKQAKDTFAHMGDEVEILKKILKLSLTQKEPRRNVSGLTQVSLYQNSRTRYLSAQTKRNVYQRDQSQCQNCGSKYALQMDHITPYSTGGSNQVNNLRLLCRSCNLHAGIQKFGLKKMNRA